MVLALIVQGIVAVWVLSCLKDCYCPVDIANEIAPSGSGVDSLGDCSHVDHVLFEITRLL